MPTFKFSKLVRDKIVDQQIASGAVPKYRILSDKEHEIELVNKIIEEAREISQATKDELASEIADVEQALDDLKTKLNISDKDVEKAKTTKNEKSGSFSRGVYIESVKLDENDDWTKYYRKNSDRYPEI